MGRILKKTGHVRLPVPPGRICPICMESLVPGKDCGQLPCGHNTFCFKCIREWAEVTNTCPLCKNRFSIIVKCICKVDDILPVPGDCLMVEDKDMHLTQPNPTFADFIREIRCVVCGSDMDENIMLLCDECDKGFHTTCINLDHIPNLEMWYCETCIVSQAPQTVANQEEEMKLAAKKAPTSSVKKLKRIKKAADLEATRRRPIEEYRTLMDFPAGYFEACDPDFESVANSLTSKDW